MVDLSLIVPIAALVGILFAAYLTSDVLRQPKGTERMQEIARAIREGANAFMRRQYTTIAMLAGFFAVVFAVALGLTSAGGWVEGAATAGAFGLGATFSALSGYIGFQVSVRANLRTANHSVESMIRGLKTALRGGAVTGLLIISLSLLGVWGIYNIYNVALPNISRCVPGDDLCRQTEVINSIVGFGFGASLVALFAQLGGGIYTKAADVGADLVGKIEAGIPEDDPRNPAVIADLVGDNVGDCAGRGADLFESTAAENIGAMILGAALFPIFGINGVYFPLVARAFGLMASIVGVFVVQGKEEDPPMRPLNHGYYATTVLALALFGFSAWSLLNPMAGYRPPAGQAAPPDNTWLFFFGAGIVGIVTALLFVFITQYYTEARYRPVKDIARASTTGPATNIIAGVSVGLEATAIPGVIIAGAILSAFWLGDQTHIVIGGIPVGGLYGTAVATMGMLSTAAYILAMDTFGPISDNAGGIVEMAGISDEARRQVDRLDAAGNTTKALTKGYAVGSAALAAFLLFSAYLERIAGLKHHAVAVDLAQPPVFVGALLGVVIVFLFSALAIRAVGRAAYYIINDVRAQFKEHPDILEGKTKPDYGRTVDIATRGALKEMVVPGVLAVAGPVVVGLLLRSEALGGLLMVGTISGVIMALFLNTGGGAWDNAKKYIETGQYGGKRSESHKAAVVGDTVGDPFKDTAGPSLHILVKLLSTITLVLAPLFV